MIEPETNEEDTPAGRRMDPELRAMGAILRTMEDLPEASRGRVIIYLSLRYQATPHDNS